MRESKKKEVLLYLFFGVLTTAVNVMVYFVFRSVFSMEMWLANSLSWMISVLFAYLTNRMWVFQSTKQGRRHITLELINFVFYRGLSFVLDMLSMLLLLDFLQVSDFYSKLITQVIVVVANYLFSKWLIFKT